MSRIDHLLLIPDTQVRPGVNTDHLGEMGEYIAEAQPDVIVHIGDHWDMPSLSSYDKGTAKIEGRRVRTDIESGNVEKGAEVDGGFFFDMIRVIEND